MYLPWLCVANCAVLCEMGRCSSCFVCGRCIAASNLTMSAAHATATHACTVTSLLRQLLRQMLFDMPCCAVHTHTHTCAEKGLVGQAVANAPSPCRNCHQKVAHPHAQCKQSTKMHRLQVKFAPLSDVGPSKQLEPIVSCTDAHADVNKYIADSVQMWLALFYICVHQGLSVTHLRLARSGRICAFPGRMATRALGR